MDPNTFQALLGQRWGSEHARYVGSRFPGSVCLYDTSVPWPAALHDGVLRSTARGFIFEREAEPTLALLRRAIGLHSGSPSPARLSVC